MKKKFLAILLAALMVVSMLPTMAFAEGGSTPISSVALTVGEYTGGDALPTVTVSGDANYTAGIDTVVFLKDGGIRCMFSENTWMEFGDEGPAPLDEAPDVSGLDILLVLHCDANSGYAFHHNDKDSIQVTVNNNATPFKDDESFSTGWAFSEKDLQDDYEDEAITVTLALNTSSAGTHTHDAWTGKPETVTGSGTEADSYLISTLDELNALATAVNGGMAFEGTYFKLTADIGDATTPFTTPIGNYTKQFKGNFDGDGHTVTLKISGSSYLGLFGCLNGGSIKNVTTAGEVGDKNTDNIKYAAGVCGRNIGGTIENCVNKATVTSKSSSNGMGGICGENEGGTINGCSNTAMIKAWGTNAQNFGGICGQNYTGSILNCVNTGTVYTYTGGSYTFGGICGLNGGVASTDLNEMTADAIIANCVSNGLIYVQKSGSGNCQQIGGVVGANKAGTTYKSMVVNCFFGSVIVPPSTKQPREIPNTSNMGGVVGYNYELATGKAVVSNCYFASDLSHTSYGATLATEAVTGHNTAVSNTLGMTSAQMKAASGTVLTTGVADNKPLVDLLNGYKDDGDSYPAGWNKWTVKGDAYPTFKFVAEISGTKFATLADAVAAAKDGDTVKLLDDCSGGGIQIPNGKFGTTGLTVDFNGKTYTVDGTAVGSVGTVNQAFQILSGNKIEFKNGTVAIGTENTNITRVIQNYADLKLTGMNFSDTNLKWRNGSSATVNDSVMEFDNGTVSITDTTITASNGRNAFAVDQYASGGYTGGTNVTVTNSKIIGNIRIYDELGTIISYTNSNLMIESLAEGSNATISVDEGTKGTTAQKASTVELEAPDGYYWYDNSNNMVLKELETSEISGVKMDYPTGQPCFYVGDTVGYTGTPELADGQTANFTYTWYESNGTGSWTKLETVPSAAGNYKLVIDGKSATSKGTQEIEFSIVPNPESENPESKIEVNITETVDDVSGDFGAAGIANTDKEIINTVLNDEERAALASGESVTVWLTVNDSSAPDDLTKVNAELAKQSGEFTVTWLDVSLWKKVGENEGAKITELESGNIKIVIDLTGTSLLASDGVDRTYKIVRIHGDEVTVLDATFDPETKKLTFETDRWSNYGIAFSDVNCEYTETVKLTENGTYGLKLNCEDVGEFTFAQVSGGWSIKQTGEDGKYLAMKDGKLAYTDKDNATVWTYKNGAFSTSVQTTQEVKSFGGWLGGLFNWLFGWGGKTTTKEVTTTYYLSTVTENAKLSTNSVKAELYEEVSGAHDYKYVSKGNGTHDKVCRNCNDTVNEPCVYDEMTQMCVCGAYDPSCATMDVTATYATKTQKQFSGFLFWGRWKDVTTYTATVKVNAEGMKVTKIEVSANQNKGWTKSNTFTSNSEIEQFFVRVTTSDGAKQLFMVKDGIGYPAN